MDKSKMLPKTFKLGGHSYTTICPYDFSVNENLAGQHSSATKEIKVREMAPGGSLQSDTATFQIFLHEIFHAIDQIFCMDNIGKECNKELLLDGLAEGFTQFLLENDLWKTPKE